MHFGTDVKRDLNTCQSHGRFVCDFPLVFTVSKSRYRLASCLRLSWTELYFISCTNKQPTQCDLWVTDSQCNSNEGYLILHLVAKACFWCEKRVIFRDLNSQKDRRLRPIFSIFVFFLNKNDVSVFRSCIQGFQMP